MERWLESFARANFQRSADTAHDLKTPLNVAVLNLELLRMRLRKLGGEDDEKVTGYTRAIEIELRRMSRIFDAFFLLSTPPKNEDVPGPIDIVGICDDTANKIGFVIEAKGPATVAGHESRIREACRLFFEGAAKLFVAEGRSAVAARDAGRYTIQITGSPASSEFDLSKIFKFYYSDADGNPDLSLAVARLIAETYGGELEAVDERDKVSLRLSFPLGAQ